MEKFQLSLLFKIIGIGSASGLVYYQDKLYIISDNSTFLYEYTISNESLHKIPLVENPQDTIIKKNKPDFESITLHDDHLMLLGSGSTANRNTIAKYNIKSNTLNSKNISGLFSILKKEHSLNDDELNIEGLIIKNGINYLFQRGNGLSGKNGILYYDETNENVKTTFISIDLPKIKNVPATFTDAILVEDKIYFLAAAEDTSSTYDDGEVLGSIVGTIDFKTMKLESTLQISNKHKFEGLTVYKKTATQLELLLCEDTDSEVLVTDIYSLIINK
ncbi:MAG: hypothetical protein IM568_10825 [Flavobacterium sp.]|nr:hypothetical protein [Flavobacterium sp.]